ncbi:acyltransferase [Blastomyces gilchristii SLH14081]|uniref:Acyltransferase n=1 Tax=Blastomyces gilchristii (strain SLH14081) TaxID=559298 RepID=A0A179U957_BLAGS|nr:acyltransferase [Blastomyces gilchristii SLH14081]OAT03829.1 acyltransferase [Blastomyces gilchristii SLH14081]
MVDQCSRSLACCEQSPGAFKCSSSPIDERASPLNFSSTPSAAKNQESRADDWEDSDSNFDPKSDSHSGSHLLPPRDISMYYLDRFCLAIVPSFLRHLVETPSNKDHAPLQKLHTIAALDGLRGWACLLVFNFHFLFTYTDKTAVGWGFGEDNWGIHQLPIIHMLISGHVMVTIFFVISGYVLSYRPLKLLRNRSWAQAFHTLASSTFRRGLRLYIPSIVGILCVLIAVRLGFYHYSTWVRDQGHTILGINEQHPPYFVSFIDQVADCYLTVVHLIDPWNWGLYYNFYNPHLWTIPVEFRCSMVLFLTIICVSRFRTWIRLTLVSGLLYYCIRWGRWDLVLFLSGMLMAEVDIIHGLWEDRLPILLTSTPIPLENQHEREPSHDGTNNSNNIESAQYTTPTSDSCFTRHRSPHRLLWVTLFIIGLFIGSSPNSAPQHTPFYRTLASTLTPSTYPEPHRFLQSLGAIMIVWSINRSADLQKLFTNALAQYLGRVSYAFYIVHGPILHSLGYALMPNIWALTGKDTDAQYCFGITIGWLICLPVSIWAADMFWRGVDVPTVRFARWVERRLLVTGL